MKISTSAYDVTQDLVKIEAILLDLYSPFQAVMWMNMSNSEFNGSTPFSMVQMGFGGNVIHHLEKISEGTFT